MRDFFRSFQRWFRRDGRRQSSGPMAPAVPRLMQQLEATRETELSCDEILLLMDECAEAVLRGEDHTRTVPLFEKHLELCGDCREEFEALLKILRTART